MEPAPLDQLERALAALSQCRVLPKAFSTVRKRSGVDIERSTATVLAEVVHGGPTTVAEIAKRIGIDASTASRQVLALEAQGLVLREQHAFDGRAVTVTATLMGRRALRRVRRARHDILRDAVAGWAPEDVALLSDMMAKLARTYSAAVLGAEHEVQASTRSSSNGRRA